MGTKYSSQSATGYNSSPPSDDGTAVSSNEVKWSFIKTKIGDPVKDLADNINAALGTHFDESVVDKAVNYTTTAADHKRTINATAAITVSLGDATTMAAGYIVKVKNSHTAAITVNLATGTDTLDGTVAGSVTLGEDEAAEFITDAAVTGYYIHKPSSFPAGTLMLFQQTAAPTGWTKETTHNNKALRVVTGTASSGGTNSFSTVWNTAFSSDSFTLLEAHIPAHDHGSVPNHTHTYGNDTAEASSGTGAVNDASNSGSYTTGGAGGHTHTSFGGGGGHSHNISMDVQYVDLIICSKD